MPLSEEELRLLEQMERALEAEDPKFVSVLQGRSLERSARLRAAGAVVIFLGGLAMLFGGAMAQLIWLSILGFVVMLASATLGLTAWRGRHAPRERQVPDQPLGGESAHYSGHRFHLIDGGKRDRKPRRSRPHTGRAGAGGGGGGFMHRIEQRWQDRRNHGL